MLSKLGDNGSVKSKTRFGENVRKVLLNRSPLKKNQYFNDFEVSIYINESNFEKEAT